MRRKYPEWGTIRIGSLTDFASYFSQMSGIGTCRACIVLSCRGDAVVICVMTLNLEERNVTQVSQQGKANVTVEEMN